METSCVEKALKNELKCVEKKIRKKEALEFAGWLGSVTGTVVVLTTMADHIALLLSMTAGGILLNMAATRFFSRKE